MTTRGEVIAAAKSADPSITDDSFDHHNEADFAKIERFYAIAFEAGRSFEREECAKAVEQGTLGDKWCGDIIRERSTK